MLWVACSCYPQSCTGAVKHACTPGAGLLQGGKSEYCAWKDDACIHAVHCSVLQINLTTHIGNFIEILYGHDPKMVLMSQQHA